MTIKHPRLISAIHPSRADLILLLFLFLAALYLTQAPPRIYPISLLDPLLQFPHLPDIFPASQLFPLVTLLPISLALLLDFRNFRSKRPLLLLFTFSLLECDILSILLANALKILVARPRPYFAAACISYAPNSDVQCTGDPSQIMDARKSFPSGHSTVSFAAATFFTLYLAAKFRFGAATPAAAPHLWHIIAVLLPLCGAAFVAASRIIDYHHHYADVVAGSVLGAGVACVVFAARGPVITKMMHEEEASEEDGDDWYAYEAAVGEIEV